MICCISTILSIPYAHQHPTIFPPNGMRQTPKLDRILHQNHRILCRPRQNLPPPSKALHTQSPHTEDKALQHHTRIRAVFPQSQDKARRVMHPNILPEPWARPHQQCRCPVLPRLFDILLGSPATIVRHVHEGTMTGVQSYQTRSTKYVQMSCLTDHSSL